VKEAGLIQRREWGGDSVPALKVLSGDGFSIHSPSVIGALQHERRAGEGDRPQKSSREHVKFTSQLEGRAGRRSTLEDGERILWRCIYYRPHAISPRILLMENLLSQGR